MKISPPMVRTFHALLNFNCLTKSYNKFCLNIVSINAELDANALKDLKEFETFRTAEGNDIFTKTFDDPNTWTYAIAVFDILLYINKNLEQFDDFPLSINDSRKLHIGIRKSIEYGLKPFLLGASIPIDSRLPYIITSTKVILGLVNNKFFPLICTRSNQHLVYTDLISSIFLILCNVDGERQSMFEEHLHGIQSKISHSDYFKILFLIMGSCKNKNGSSILQIVHTQLMQTLHRTGGFVALCEALLPSTTSLEQDEEIMKKRLQGCATISSIIGKKGHGNQFYHQTIDEIFGHLRSYIQGNKSNQVYFIDAAVQSLRKICLLRSTYIQRDLLHNLFDTIDKLAKPNDSMAGAIVCDANQFTIAIHLIHLTFCATGPDGTLPSELLTPFVPIFIQIYHVMNESKNKLLKNELLAIIIRCLSNRDKTELNRIIEMVLFEEYTENVRHLHTRIKVERIEIGESDGLIFSIAAVDLDEHLIHSSDDLDINSFLRPSISMVNVLKQSNHNTLIYNAFLCLLQLFSDNYGVAENIEDLSSCNSEFLGSESEFRDAIENTFKKKYAIINALNELILFKQFHGQFVENSLDLCAILDRMLIQQIKRIEMHRSNGSSLPENIQEILVVILLCVGEFMERIKSDDQKAQLMQTLGNLKFQLQTDQIRSNVAWKAVFKNLDSLLNNDMHSKSSEFTKFKHILSDISSEPYTTVYGIMNIIKLIRAKDEETCSNAHVILVLSLKLLKEAEDSYIFLNCIKLLIALFDILGGTVLDALAAEYHFDIDSDTADIDFKLKIGETIVKVIQGLGEMCFNYKDLLLNCFLRGIYNKNDEFRTSNISNLGVVLRILSYQVHHFFHEVRTNTWCKISIIFH